MKTANAIFWACWLGSPLCANYNLNYIVFRFQSLYWLSKSVSCLWEHLAQISDWMWTCFHYCFSIAKLLYCIFRFQSLCLFSITGSVVLRSKLTYFCWFWVRIKLSTFLYHDTHIYWQIWDWSPPLIKVKIEHKIVFLDLV